MTPHIGPCNSPVTLSPKTLLPKPDKIGYIDFDDHKLEFVKYYRRNTDTMSLILLHEGLGSVSMWRSFPAYLASTTAKEVIAFSRRGYGASSSRETPYRLDYMHVEAQETLPRLLQFLNITEPVLIGHSDGASIALIHAADQRSKTRGIIVMAPHIMVEPKSIQAIELTRQQYYASNLEKKLRRYHNDPASTFKGWNDIWLNPDFLKWDIRELLPKIRCPILAIQGENDPYGSMAQIDQIKSAVKSDVKLLKLEDCGHSPHREKTEETMAAIKTFIRAL